MDGTLKTTVKVSLDTVNFEEKPCKLVFRTEDGELMLLADDYSVSMFFNAIALADFLAEERGMIAPKSNHDVQKIWDTAEKLFYRKKIEDLEAKAKG